MKIYLDDCLTAKTLAQLLKKAEFNVVLPEQVGLQGRSDAEHFQFCCQKGYVLHPFYQLKNRFYGIF